MGFRQVLGEGKMDRKEGLSVVVGVLILEAEEGEGIHSFWHLNLQHQILYFCIIAKQ